MSARTRIRIASIAAAACVLAQGAPSLADDGASQRDGQHDFDFIIGTWKCHLKKLQHPLTGSNTWDEYDGTAVSRPVWGGRANLDVLEAEDPTTHARIEGLTLRLYNPQSHEWSLYWANARNGTLGLPPTVGRFNNGRGEFYDNEELDGRQITVRYLWKDITASSARFEQAFSTDGGKTWETNWIYTSTRVQE